jgi:phospholipase C
MAQPSPIQHVVIIVKENHAFDNYFGRFPGATEMRH